MTERKHCTRCARDLPLAELWFARLKRGGWSPWCRDCKRVYDREYKRGCGAIVRPQLHELERSRRAKVTLPKLNLPPMPEEDQ